MRTFTHIRQWRRTMPKQSSTRSIENPDISSVGQFFPDCGRDSSLSDVAELHPFDSSVVVYNDQELLRPNFVRSDEEQSPIRNYLQDLLDRNSEHELAKMWWAVAEYVSNLSRLRPNRLQCGQAVFGESHLGTISRLTDSVVVVR